MCLSCDIKCFAMNGSWMIRDGVHLSEGWSQDIFSRCQEMRRVQSVHLFIYTNTSIYNYTTWSNNEQHLLFGSGQTRVRVPRQRRTIDTLSELHTRSELASENISKITCNVTDKIPFTTGGYLECDYGNFGNRIRIPNSLTTLCKRNKEFSRY